MERQTNFFIKEIKPLDFGETNIGYELIGTAFELPFETIPTKGKHDFNKCKGCKKAHTIYRSHLKAKYEGTLPNKKPFPFCCSGHFNLIKHTWFKKKDFDLRNIPLMVANKIIFSTQHIINSIKSENWFEDITDYLEYTISSFGQMPEDCGEPLYLSDYIFYVSEGLKGKKDLPKDKLDPIIEFLKDYNSTNYNPKEDLNILLKTYQEWYEIFPFDLSYFENIKQAFQPSIPLFSFAEVPRKNPYTGIPVSKKHTKSSLIEFLIKVTNNLLTEINGLTLYEKGLIPDTDKIKFELIVKSRKLKLKEGYLKKPHSEEQQYRDILKEWFDDEKQFINEISLIAKALPLPQSVIESIPIPQQREKSTPDQKPIFKPESVQTIFEFFKDFFKPGHQTLLREILETGENSREKLLFKDNGNRLADGFKKLIDADLITGCQKQDLEKWLINNFNYYNRKEIAAYTPDYAEKCISRNYYPCKKPIFEVIDGKILRPKYAGKKNSY